MSNLNELPNELLYCIFRFLDVDTVDKLGKVCKKFAEIASSDHLLKEFLPADFNASRYSFFGVNAITNKEMLKEVGPYNSPNGLAISKSDALKSNSVVLNILLKKMWDDPFKPFFTSNASGPSEKLAVILNLLKKFLILYNFPEESVFYGKSIIETTHNQAKILFGDNLHQLMLEQGNITELKNTVGNFLQEKGQNFLELLQNNSQTLPPLSETESINYLSVGIGMLAILFSSDNYSSLEYWQICLGLLLAVGGVCLGLEGLGFIKSSQERNASQNFRR